MAYYVLDGYSTPYGVDSRQKVKEYQQKLGVAADGIWGPKTQEAYEKNVSGNIWSKPYDPQDNSGTAAYDSSAFDSFYETILSHISVPQIDYTAPSSSEIAAEISAAIYPSVMQAQETRKKQGEINKAEIDADAYARGMGASTYVSSVKADENADIASDISAMESDYQAMLADKLMAALQYYAGIEADTKYKNASMQQSANDAALSYASQWYLNWLKQQESAAQASSTSSNTNKTTSNKANTTNSDKAKAADSEYKKSGLSAQDYEKYVSGLTASQRAKLFSSTDSYWAVRREELIRELGEAGYQALKKKYGDRTGGSGSWKLEKS